MKKVFLVLSFLVILAIVLPLTGCGCSSDKSQVSSGASVNSASSSSAELAQLRKEYENYKIEATGKNADLQNQINAIKSKMELIETAYKSAISIQKSAQEAADTTMKTAYESAIKTLSDQIEALRLEIKNLKSSQSTTYYPPPTTIPPVNQFTVTVYSGENFNSLVGSFSESTISHDWSSGGLYGLYEHYSAKVNGTIYSSVARYYQFTIRVDDGARLYVNGNLEMNLWRTGSVVSYTRAVYLKEGYNTIQIDYFQGTGMAVFEVTWY